MQICARMEQKMAVAGNRGGKVYKRVLLCRHGLYKALSKGSTHCQFGEVFT